MVGKKAGYACARELYAQERRRAYEFDIYSRMYLFMKHKEWFERNNPKYIIDTLYHPLKGAMSILRDSIANKTQLSLDMLYDLAKICVVYTHPHLSAHQKVSILHTPLYNTILPLNILGSAVKDGNATYILLNSTTLPYLKKDQLLEVLFHEIKHIVQYYEGKEKYYSKEMMEGEATYYGVNMVRTLNPLYESIVSEEYLKYAEEYAKRFKKIPSLPSPESPEELEQDPPFS